MAISWKRNAARKPAPARLPAAARSRAIPYGINETKRTRLPQILAGRGSLPAGRGHPALPTASPRIGYIILFKRLSTMSFRALVEKSPAVETKPNIHDYSKILDRGGSPPRNPPRQKRNRTYTNKPNTCQQGLPAAPARLSAPARRHAFYLSVNFFLSLSALVLSYFLSTGR